MKNKIYLIIVLFAFAVIGGCKKKNEPNPVIPKGKPCENSIESFIGANKLSGFKMFYDENARLVKLTIDDSGTGELNYNYEQDKIKVSSSGTLYYEITLSNGRATRISETGKSIYQDLTYNADGYLSSAKEYSNAVLQEAFYLSYTNGNLTSVRIAYNDPADEKNGTVEYSSDLSSARLTLITPVYSMLRYYVPAEYLGKLSKNAVTKYSIVNVQDTHRFEVLYAYTYAKDGDGKFNTASEVNSTKSYNNGQLISSSGSTIDYHFNFGCD